MTDFDRTIPQMRLIACCILGMSTFSATRGDAQSDTDAEFVVVCQDAGAGGYEALPDVCRLKDGRLMCAFYAGYDHESPPNDRFPLGGRIASSISTDEGRTWSPAAVLIDSEFDDRDASLTQLDDGRLICAYFCAGEQRQSHVVVSNDAGATWSPLHTFPRNYFVSSPVRQLTNGRLILGLYYAEKDHPSRGAIVTSDDGGKTWNDIIDLKCPKVSLDAETDVIELQPGRLYAALRDSFGPMHESSSQDNGNTWSTPKPVNFLAHCPYLHRAPDGAILLGYREATPAAMKVLKTGQWAPDDTYRTAVRISRNDCRTWGRPRQIDQVGGAYTSMVNLPDDSILVVYYEERPGADIRAKRFRVTKSGIKFLPVDSQ